MYLGTVELDCLSSVKYLRINFITGLSMKAVISCMQYKLYVACNSIIYKCKNANEFVKLGLVKYSSVCHC